MPIMSLAGSLLFSTENSQASFIISTDPEYLNAPVSGKVWQRIKGWVSGFVGKVKNIFEPVIKPIASTVVSLLPPPANLIGQGVVHAVDKGIKILSNVTAHSN